MLNPYSTKRFLASLDFCCAGERPTNTRPRNQAPNLFKETHVEQRKRMHQELGVVVLRARTSDEKHKMILSPQKRNCRPNFVSVELNYTEHTKNVAYCTISQFHLYLLSGFVRKNKTTERVEIFQRSPFLRLWNDLQKQSGKMNQSVTNLTLTWTSNRVFEIKGQGVASIWSEQQWVN